MIAPGAPIDPARWQVTFYNLRVSRPQLRVREEIHALLLSDPEILAGCEAVGYLLPEIPGYRLLRNRRTASHSNVFAYVSDEIPVTKVRWQVLRKTWRRTQHAGQHEPRVILKFRAGGVRFAVTHAPQVDGANTMPARDEILSALALLACPWRRPLWNLLPAAVRDTEKLRPSVVLWDPNALGKSLATLVGGRDVGTAIEGAVSRGQVVASKGELITHASGVELRSDHRHAFRFELWVPRRWAVR